MTKQNKQFPQTELQEEIREFWSIRGYEEVRAVLGNLNVSFHKTNSKYDSLGLNYQYLEQFWNLAQKDLIRKQIELLNNLNRDTLDIYELKMMFNHT